MNRMRRHFERHDAIAWTGGEAPEAPVTEPKLRGKLLGATPANAHEASCEPGELRVAASSGREQAEFVSLLTQELRQSLQAMLGFTQLMDRDAKEPLPERQRKRARSVLDAGDHVLRIVDDACALSRIQAGQAPMTIQAVDVLDALDRVRTALEPAAMSRRVQIAIGSVLSLTQRPAIRADAGSFAQVLLRLASNAIEYNKPRGSVTFHVAPVGSSQLRTSVVDTGTGIAREDQSKLFRPFPRMAHPASIVRGAGLGLVMCKSLVELMGGSIGYRSVPDQGSEFWVDLPVYTG